MMKTRFPLLGLSGAAVAVVLLAVTAAPSAAEDPDLGQIGQAAEATPPPTTPAPPAEPETDPDSEAEPPPPSSFASQEYRCWAAAMAGVAPGAGCDPRVLPSLATRSPENRRLLSCFSAAVSGRPEGCTIGLTAPTISIPPAHSSLTPATAPGGEYACWIERDGPGGESRLVCPPLLAGLSPTVATDCGYLHSFWCTSASGTPREVLLGQLDGCTALAEDAPLTEVVNVAPGYLRGAPGLVPSTVNMRASCVKDIMSRLVTLAAPRGWFNSAAAPRTSAGFPMSTYHLYHQGGGLTELHRPFVGMVLSLVWQFGLVALRIAMWLFDWAVGGHVTAILAGIPGELAALLQNKVVRGLRLYEMGLLLLGTTAGWRLLRGRVADAAGTVTFAFLMFALGWFLLTPTAFQGYYAGALETRKLLADGLTLGVIADASNGGLDAAEAMQVVLDSAVHTPWEHLNFGQSLTGGNWDTNTKVCHVERAREILIDGIRSQAATDVDILGECGDAGAAMADFAGAPTGERMFGAVLVAAGQVAVAALIFVAAGLALLSEVLLGSAFAVLPVAVAGVLWPGGRRVAGAWLSLLLRGLVGFAAGMLFLSLVMTVIAAVIGRTQGLALLERSLVFLLVAYGGWRLRKVFPTAARQISAQFGGKVSAAFSQQGAGVSPALGGAAGGLAGGLAAAYLTPGRMMASGARLAHRGGAGALQRVTGLTAAATGAAVSPRLDSVAAALKRGDGAAAAAAAPGRGLSLIHELAAGTKGGQAALASKRQGGVLGSAAQIGAEGLARRLAGRANRADVSF